MGGFDLLKGSFRVSRRSHLVPLQCQQPRKAVDDRRVIIDDENRAAWYSGHPTDLPPVVVTQNPSQLCNKVTAYRFAIRSKSQHACATVRRT
jgi:hypothetical protein